MASPPSQPNGVIRDQALRFMLERRGAAIVPVTAGETSMVPHLYGGDAVLAVPLGRPPAPGDLLLYRQQDYWVVHRCLGTATGPDGAPGFRTRGDGRNVLDPHLLSDNILARVVALRRAGQWSSLLLVAWATHVLVGAALRPVRGVARVVLVGGRGLGAEGASRQRRRRAGPRHVARGGPRRFSPDSPAHSASGGQLGRRSALIE